MKKSPSGLEKKQPLSSAAEFESGLCPEIDLPLTPDPSHNSLSITGRISEECSVVPDCDEGSDHGDLNSAFGPADSPVGRGSCHSRQVPELFPGGEEEFSEARVEDRDLSAAVERRLPAVPSKGSPPKHVVTTIEEEEESGPPSIPPSAPFASALEQNEAASSPQADVKDFLQGLYQRASIGQTAELGEIPEDPPHEDPAESRLVSDPVTNSTSKASQECQTWDEEIAFASAGGDDLLIPREKTDAGVDTISGYVATEVVAVAEVSISPPACKVRNSTTELFVSSLDIAPPPGRTVRMEVRSIADISIVARRARRDVGTSSACQEEIICGSLDSVNIAPLDHNRKNPSGSPTGELTWKEDAAVSAIPDSASQRTQTLDFSSSRPAAVQTDDAHYVEATSAAVAAAQRQEQQHQSELRDMLRKVLETASGIRADVSSGQEETKHAIEKCEAQVVSRCKELTCSARKECDAATGTGEIAAKLKRLAELVKAAVEDQSSKYAIQILEQNNVLARNAHAE